VVSVPYFKWTGGELVEKLINKWWFLEWYGWRPREGDTTTILLKDPVAVSGLTSAYLQGLPYVPSDKGAPGPMPGYVYQQGKCLTCTNKPRIDPAKLEELQAMATKPPQLSPEWMGEFLMWLGVAIAIFFAFDIALKGWDQPVVFGVFSAMKWLLTPRQKPGTAPTQ
jgi:hypothetical protein